MRWGINLRVSFCNVYWPTCIEMILISWALNPNYPRKFCRIWKKVKIKLNVLTTKYFRDKNETASKVYHWANILVGWFSSDVRFFLQNFSFFSEYHRFAANLFPGSCSNNCVLLGFNTHTMVVTHGPWQAFWRKVSWALKISHEIWWFFNKKNRKNSTEDIKMPLQTLMLL